MSQIHVTERLRALRKRSGLTMQETAKALGFAAASSYQRYEDEDLTTADELPPKIVRKLADAFTGKGFPPITRAEVLALANIDESLIARPDGIKYGGIVEAGAFRRSNTLNQDAPTRIIPIAPDPRFSIDSQYAFEVAGDSMNKANILPEMWAVAVDIHEWERQRGDPEDMALVVVAQTHSGDPARELTVKRLRIFRDRLELRPESTNEAHEPIVFSNPPQPSEEREVAIIGVLLSAVWLFGYEG